MGGFCCCCGGKDSGTSFPRKEGFAMGRTVTDACPLIVFFAFIAGMVACVLSGFWYGDMKRLTHGVDWEGNVCGISDSVKEQKFMIFCGSPERVGDFPKFILQGSTACVAACPTDTSTTINCLMPAFHNFTSYKGGNIGAVKNAETLEMTLTQSVTMQTAYPTEAWGGRFCLPCANDNTCSSKNQPLRDIIINGPWGHYYRPQVSIGGLMDAWPLLLIAACTACLMGYIYIWCLGQCAGIIIFTTMVGAVLFGLAMGLFFFFAIFFDMDDPHSKYAHVNPIMSVFIGDEAKIYSIVTGVVILLSSVIGGALTFNSLGHIDEMVGIIAASCECFNAGCQLRIMPLVQSAFLLVAVAALVFLGLPLVASLGVLDYSEIQVNGIGVQGMQRVWKKEPLQQVELWYYFIGMILMLEFFVQFSHWVVSYTVASWYFTKGEIKDISSGNQMLDRIGKGAGKKTEVRVAGVDANYGQRQGTIIDGPGGKVLVVPVGKKGPGVGRNDMVLSEFQKPSIPFGSATAGMFVCFLHHVGSLALGCPVIFIFRPFRLIAHGLTSFLAMISDPSKGPGHANDPHTSNLKGCLGLFSACLEQVFGKYSRIAWTEQVLNGQDGFFDCSEASFQFLVKSGGSIAYLHGSMLLYELFGSLCITMFCTWLTVIFQAELDIFNEKTSPYYIEDKDTSLIAAAIISFTVSYTWMSMWNQTADVLLYCVAWNRNQKFLGEEHDLDESKQIGEIDEYCPQTLRNILPAYELTPHFEHGLHAHGLGQQGAILAAMEHGAMNHGEQNSAPQYSKMVADAHLQGTKIFG